MLDSPRTNSPLGAVARGVYRTLTVATLVLLLLVLAGVVYFLSTDPVAYQKIMALRVGVPVEPDWDSAADAFDAPRVIGAIPYSGNATLAYVLPSELYEATLLNGLGNCANKSRGLSYYLEQRGLPFQRIELLSAEAYLRGSGHVLIRTKYTHAGETRVGLVDMLEGGLPAKGVRPIDLDELKTSEPFTISILPLNNRCDRHSDYYGTFLDSVVFATSQSDEIRRYFRWVERIYVPLGSPVLERFVCNASAIVLGWFPGLFVSQADYDRLVGPNKQILLIAQTMTWATRGLLVLLPTLVALKLGLLVRARWKGSATPSVVPDLGGDRGIATAARPYRDADSP